MGHVLAEDKYPKFFILNTSQFRSSPTINNCNDYKRRYMTLNATIICKIVTMETHFSLFLCALSISAALAVPVKEGCSESKCKGPMQYYEELGCKPVYKKPDDCCPHKYNCDKLKERKTDKCYINGKEYAIGERLKEEDANPCDIGCTCTDRQGVAQFTCAIVDCFHGPMQPGCYFTKNATDCCNTQVCPENPEDKPKCEVEGKTYEAGQYFSPSSDPNTNCYCNEGFNGEFKAPWCKTRVSSLCGVDLRHAYEVHNKCAPVYYSDQSPQTDCAIEWRCQNPKDEVIKHDSSESKSDSSEEKSDDMKCKFGDLEMNIGDELNQGTYYSSVCVKCVCNVPPIPTCQRLPDDQCDITKHPSFDRK